MPSPVGHSLLGLAMGVAWLLPRARTRELARHAWRLRWPLLGCVALANAPDLDYVPGIATGDFNAYHHACTHSIGWCALVAAGIWCLLRARRAETDLSALGWLAAILLSHLAADLVTADRRPPFGLMALWPFDDRFYISPVTMFAHLRKRTYAEFLQWHNVRAVLLEAAWCLPVLALAWRGRSSGTRRVVHDATPDEMRL